MPSLHWAVHRAVRSCLALLACVFSVAACSSGPPVVVLGGEKVAPERIDADPLALLPREAIMVGSIDAARMFRSSVGGQVAQIVENLLPLGAESDFVPSRDVRKIYGAFYAMQGADFCAVLQGTFRSDAIRSAAQRRAMTRGGVPLVRTDYAGVEMYTVNNVGFVLLTENTILTGNEIGMRRALDRLRYGRFEKHLPAWAIEVLQHEQAAFAAVGDFEDHATVAALSDQFPLAKGMKVMRVLGNFQAPGLNVVGTIGYHDEAGAERGKAALAQVQQLASFMSLFATLGFAASPPTLTSQVRGKELAFATKLDTQAVGLMLSLLVQVTRPRR